LPLNEIELPVTKKIKDFAGFADTSLREILFLK